MLKRILVLSAVLMLMCGGAPHAQTSNFAADFSAGTTTYAAMEPSMPFDCAEFLREPVSPASRAYPE